MPDELIPWEFLLKGRLITSQDPSVIGENFQSLKNMRYTDTNPEGIGGMTPINSTALTYSSMREGYHLKKDQPSETHVLIHTFDTSLQNGRIVDHTTAIPSSGNFGSSAMFTCSDTTTERKGCFSPAPQGGVAFCDGKDSLIWSGNEMEIGSFINYDPKGTFSKDYTDVLQNTLTDTDNIATLTRVVAGTDANTKLLLHFDNNVTDSSTAANTVTNSGMTFSAAAKVFGTHSAQCSTAVGAQYATIPDAALFDFSGGVFTIDFRFRIDSLANPRGIYWQKRGANSTYNFRLQCTTGGKLNLRIRDDGTTVLNLNTAANTIAVNTWYHGALVESSSNYYIFVNGNLVGSTDSTVRATNTTGYLALGAGSTAGTTSLYSGYLDEIRVSDVARWTDTFQLPLSAYGTKTQTHCYLGARRPLKGFKAYVGTANASSATMTTYEWQGAGWSSVAVTDNTASSGCSLAQTGTVTFTSTATTSEPRAINDVVLYWYKIQVEGADDNITLTHVTNNAPMQQIKDLWDGEERVIVACYKDLSALNFQDFTTAVFENNYDVSSSATFMQLNSLPSILLGCGVVCGFLEQMTGLFINIAPNYGNTVANTILSLKYSSDGQTWTSVEGLVDGTSVNGISLSKTGLITWSPPSKTTEFQRTLTTDINLWYYYLQWTQTLDASVRIYYIAGISAPKKIKGYKYAMLAKNRLWLLNNEDEKENSAICCSQGLPEVWNGEDSVEYTFGDETELTGGCSLFSIIGSNIYEIALFYKRDDLWGISGSTPEDFVKYQIKITDGLVAPRTLKTAINYIGGNIRAVTIWQGAKGIYMFDNHTPVPIHGDISNFFDPRESSNTRKLHATYISNSSAFVDEEHFEYHWMFADASSTGNLNREWAFDLVRGRWYEINRGTGKYLQNVFTVMDTNSNKYNFGLLNSGIMERLEYGNHFDGNAIAHEIWTGDMALDKGRIMQEIAIRKLKLISASTTATASNLIVKHYADGNINASSSFTLSPMRTGYGVIQAKKSLKGNPAGAFHSFKINISTTNQSYGFSPMYLGGHFERVREDL